MVWVSQVGCDFLTGIWRPKWCPESWSILSFGSHPLFCLEGRLKDSLLHHFHLCFALAVTDPGQSCRCCRTLWCLSVHWSWGPAAFGPPCICVCWHRVIWWEMEGWRVKCRSLDSHHPPSCEMSAAFYQYWLSLLVQYPHFIMQIKLGRLTFQWAYIVFNGKVAVQSIKGSCL